MYESSLDWKYIEVNFESMSRKDCSRPDRYSVTKVEKTKKTHMFATRDPADMIQM